VKEQSIIEHANNSEAVDRVFESVPLFLKKTLCKLARYYNGKIYRFELIDNTLTLTLDEATENKSLILIIAREFYKEQAKIYPIDNKAELSKLLALQYPSDNNYHSYIWGSDNGQSQVNIWQFEQALPSANIYMPETLLLALSANEQEVLTIVDDVNENNRGNLFIGRLGEVIHSLRSTAVVNTPQRFIMSTGLANRADNVLKISSDNLATQLARGTKKLSFSLFSVFFKRPKKSDNLQLLKKVTIPFFTVLFIYLALTSGYLVVKKYNLAQELANNSAEVSQALSLQQKLDDMQLRHSAFKSFLATQRNYSPLWLILVDIFPHAEFSNIQTSNERIVLRGSAKKATQVLQLLSDDVRILDAKFDFPTRKNRGRDVFVISFKLAELEQLTSTHQKDDPIAGT